LGKKILEENDDWRLHSLEDILVDNLLSNFVSSIAHSGSTSQSLQYTDSSNNLFDEIDDDLRLFSKSSLQRIHVFMISIVNVLDMSILSK